jgi:sigma-B regulation protein RsbU (phosphoserine phosphatase)
VQSLAPRHGQQLAEFVHELNRSLHSSVESHRYATLFYSVYDESKGELSYVNAGHLPPILVRAGAATRLETLEASGTVIGLLPDGAWQQRTTTLAPGDLLCAFTDGVTEASDPAGVEFGATRLSDLLSRLRDAPAASICDAVLSTIDEFSAHAPASDDRTVIVARAHGA